MGLPIRRASCSINGERGVRIVDRQIMDTAVFMAALPLVALPHHSRQANMATYNYCWAFGAIGYSRILRGAEPVAFLEQRLHVATDYNTLTWDVPGTPRRLKGTLLYGSDTKIEERARYSQNASCML